MLKNMLEKAAKWVLVGLVSGCSFQSSQLSFILERLSPESSNDVQGVYWKLDGQGLSGRLIPVLDADRIFFTDITHWMVVFERDQIVGIYNLETGSILSIAIVDTNARSKFIDADTPDELSQSGGIVDAVNNLTYTAPGNPVSATDVLIQCNVDWQVTVDSKQLTEFTDCVPNGLRIRRIRDVEGSLLALTYEFEGETLIEIKRTTEPVELSEMI